MRGPAADLACGSGRARTMLGSSTPTVRPQRAATPGEWGSLRCLGGPTHGRRDLYRRHGARRRSRARCRKVARDGRARRSSPAPALPRHVGLERRGHGEHRRARDGRDAPAHAPRPDEDRAHGAGARARARVPQQPASRAPRHAVRRARGRPRPVHGGGVRSPSAARRAALVRPRIRPATACTAAARELGENGGEQGKTRERAKPYKSLDHDTNLRPNRIDRWPPNAARSL